MQQQQLKSLLVTSALFTIMTGEIRLNIAGCSIFVSIPGKVDLFLIHPQSGSNQYFRTFATAFSTSVGVKQQVLVTAKSHSRTISHCPACGLFSEN